MYLKQLFEGKGGLYVNEDRGASSEGSVARGSLAAKTGGSSHRESEQAHNVPQAEEICAPPEPFKEGKDCEESCTCCEWNVVLTKRQK